MEGFGNEEEEDSQKKLRRGSWILQRPVGDIVPKMILQCGTVLAVVLLLVGFWSPTTLFGKGAASSPSSFAPLLHLPPSLKGLNEALGNLTSKQESTGGLQGKLIEVGSGAHEAAGDDAADEESGASKQRVTVGERGNERGGNEVSSAAAEGQMGATREAAAAESSGMTNEPGSAEPEADETVARASSQGRGHADGARKDGGVGALETGGLAGAGARAGADAITEASEKAGDRVGSHEDASETAAGDAATGEGTARDKYGDAGRSPAHAAGAGVGDAGHARAGGVKEPQAVDPLNCTGRNVYSYKLPPEFNVALAEMCKELPPGKCFQIENEGMGKRLENNTWSPPGKWFDTQQEALEVYFHTLLLKTYGCLVHNPDQANIFHVPYYAGLDYGKEELPRGRQARLKQAPLGPKLASWLQDKRHFKRRKGADHFIVVGGPASLHLGKPAGKWAASLLALPALESVTKLVLDWTPGYKNTVAIPHPTIFHPKGARDIKVWQKHVDSADRSHLASYAGLPSSTPTLKRALARQCEASPQDCSYMECGRDTCRAGGAVVQLHLSSTFCLLPPAYSLGRQAIFDAMLAGCIPVSFDNSTSRIQYPWHLPSDRSSFSVPLAPRGVVTGTLNVLDVLRRVSPGRVKAMRRRIIYRVLPNILYKHIRGRGFTTQDAFDTSIEHMVAKAGVSSI